MKELYLWFYCLPIVDAAFLVLLATGIFLFLCRKYYNRFWWRPAMACLLVLWLVTILWATVESRAPVSSGTEISLVPFASYAAVLRGGNPELLRENLMNLFLFYPVGLLLAALLPGRWNRRGKLLLILLVCCFLSIGIELAQYRLSLGLAETDDVLHNALGGAVGVMAIHISEKQRIAKDS